MRLAPFAALAAVGVVLAAVSAPRAQPPAPKLAFPVACEIGRTCEIQHYVDRDPGPGVLDYRCGHRTNDKHDGTDIRLLDMAAQRAGVDVLAAAAGRVVAIRNGVADISIRAPGAPSVAGHECGNRVAIGLGNGWLIDYCHLAKGSLKVKVGDVVAAGQPLAHVGLSGDTEFPHLHFSVRHANLVVDPFAPAAATGCAVQPATLWTAAVAARTPYRRGVVLNAGFATASVSNAAIEERTTSTPSAAAPAVLAYARLIGLQLGDVVAITLAGPDGKVLATTTLPPLDHDKAQFTAEAGRKRPPQGWPHGVYTGEVRVQRGGAIVIARRFT
ncbi:MAG: M23 family metallopeptidase, partial [Caulobacterales bacterium]